MQIYSSTKPKLPLSSTNPNPSKSHFQIPIKTLKYASPLRITTCFSIESSAALEEKLLTADTGIEKSLEDEEELEVDDKPVKKLVKVRVKKSLKVRRPVMELPKEEVDGSSSSGESGGDGEDTITKNLSSSSMAIDAGLSEFAKKMPVFEPKRVETSPEKKPIRVNLDLALYKAKIWAREYRYEEAKELLLKCMQFWPEDGRPYVALGGILCKQSLTTEARAVYEKGCQATQGENAYIWQCWAVLENKLGNIRRARELFDAATVADKKHIASWHGWAILELKQGNLKKARNLLGKGIKYCGGNEYIYQTLGLLEAKANRVEQARYLFKQATKCNPLSCASWLAWAQLEMQEENNQAARRLFEKAVQASPKNRFAWHVWGIFESSLGFIEKGRKLLKIGHTLNPRDPVLLQSLALLEYKYSSAILARVLFKRASELDPKHQPVWMAWGWMEWKEGNLTAARQLYQRALSINSTTESAARCLQAWGVLEQRVGNMQAARRLFRASLNINSQSYVTWMALAALEEEQGNPERAEEVRDLYFQQRTEVVDDASWVMGFLDIIDPTIDRIKRLLNIERDSAENPFGNMDVSNSRSLREDVSGPSSSRFDGMGKGGGEGNIGPTSDFDLDAFIKEKLSLDASNLDKLVERMRSMDPKTMRSYKSLWTPKNKTSANSNST